MNLETDAHLDLLFAEEVSSLPHNWIVDHVE